MKKTILSCLLIAVAGTSMLFAKNPSHKKKKGLNATTNEVITLHQLIEGVARGYSKDQFQDVVLQCPVGTLIPLNLTMRGDLFSLEPNQSVALNMRLLKPCFVKYRDKNHILFSSDAQEWKDFDQFFTAKSIPSIVFPHDNLPYANLEVQLN